MYDFLLGEVTCYTSLFFRFTIAIKTSLSDDLYENESLLDEARTMLKADEYHNQIVNLQGLTIESNETNSQSLKVTIRYKMLSYILLFTISTMIIFLNDTYFTIVGRADSRVLFKGELERLLDVKPE